MTTDINEGGRLDYALTGVLYRHFRDAGAFRIESEVYEVADAIHLALLGDDIAAPDAPLILVRMSDGKFVEVELWAITNPTSPELRDAQRRSLIRARERAAARQESAGGSA